MFFRPLFATLSPPVVTTPHCHTPPSTATSPIITYRTPYHHIPPLHHPALSFLTPHPPHSRGSRRPPERRHQSEKPQRPGQRRRPRGVRRWRPAASVGLVASERRHRPRSGRRPGEPGGLECGATAVDHLVHSAQFVRVEGGAADGHGGDGGTGGEGRGVGGGLAQGAVGGRVGAGSQGAEGERCRSDGAWVGGYGGMRVW